MLGITFLPDNWNGMPIPELKLERFTLPRRLDSTKENNSTKLGWSSRKAMLGQPPPRRGAARLTAERSVQIPRPQNSSQPFQVQVRVQDLRQETRSAATRTTKRQHANYDAHAASYRLKKTKLESRTDINLDGAHHSAAVTADGCLV